MASRKGSPNKTSAAKEAYWAKQGLMPLEHMLDILRDPDQPKERKDDMAKAAAPYCHPRLATVTNQHTGLDGKPISVKLTVEFVKPKGDAKT